MSGRPTTGERTDDQMIEFPSRPTARTPTARTPAARTPAARTVVLTLHRTAPAARAGVLVATGLIAELGERHHIEALRIDADLIVLRSTGHQASLLRAELRDVLASRLFDGWALDHNPGPAP